MEMQPKNLIGYMQMMPPVGRLLGLVGALHVSALSEKEPMNGSALT